jgi:hypothetical protein
MMGEGMTDDGFDRRQTSMLGLADPKVLRIDSRLRGSLIVADVFHKHGEGRKL